MFKTLIALAVLTVSPVVSADCDQDLESFQWGLMVDVAVERCDYAADGWVEDGVSEDDASDMWEACVRLSTPVWQLSAAKHYDTQDGAFWRAGGAP